MEVYKKVFELKFKKYLQYRSSFLLNFLFSSLPLIGYIIIWIYIYKYSSVVGGFDRTQMIIYYLFSCILNVCITPDFQWDMNIDIREGGLIKFLFLPISYFKYRVSSFFAGVLLKLIINVPFILIIFVFYVTKRSDNSITFISIILFLFFMICSSIISFLLYYLLILMSFFIVEISAVSYTLEIIIQFFAGSLIPLSIFPEKLQTALFFTPFPYIIYFPLNLILEKTDYLNCLKALLIISIWILILAYCITLVWKKGLVRYDGNEK